MNIEIYFNIIKNVRLEQYAAGAAAFAPPAAMAAAGSGGARMSPANQILRMILDEQHAGRNN